MAGLDQIIVACGMGAFTGFVISHIAAFRFTSDDRILGTIQTLFCFWAGALAATVSIVPGLIPSERFLFFIFSFCAYGLASFFYVLCVFLTSALRHPVVGADLVSARYLRYN